MAKRHWTMLFISDGTKDIRQIRLPRSVVQLAIAVVLVVVSTVSSIATAAFMKVRAPGAAQELARKNDLMKLELMEIRDQTLALQTQLEDLAKHDEQFRLVAGLDPLNEDVLGVGIGGSLMKPKDKKLWELDRSSSTLAVTTSNELGELLRRAQLLNFSWREARDTIVLKHDRLESTPSIVPTNGYITSTFSRSRKHPILNRARPHEGVDIAAARGTPILSAAKGRVRFVGPDGDYGLSIEIDHGYGIVTRYAHASKTLVKRGQLIGRGETIGLVGDTGLAIGPHLHYEVLVNGRATNPREWFLDHEKVAD
jgi:murein DD-endopeptidase MepM/ murein hydrolase activator NlpD